MEETEDKARGFKVQDRRRFSPEGEARPDDEQPTPAESPATAQPKPGAQSQAHGHVHQAEGPAPELNFATFILSLSQQALEALGEIPDPAGGAPKRDLLMAQQMIDIIRMLRDKTRGNLDEHEQALVGEILSVLQMKYVELVNQPAR
ncbi:MAG TPA: DUF1844 domain-containing protein [Candidatus Binataceae bacterium]|nr:DUF1844 domain-containing protein [Candidatus Binataceae bacterium]